MMKTRKLFVTLSIMLAFIFSISFTTEAASMNTKAMRAYKPIVASRKYSKMLITAFGLQDVNKDGVKELFIRNGNSGTMIICGYDGKKVVKICTVKDNNFEYDTYYNKKTGYIVTNQSCCGSHQYYDVFKISKKNKYSKIRFSYAWADLEYEKIPDKYINKYDMVASINGKYVTRKKYDKETKKVFGKKSDCTKIVFRNNTEANRNKYIK